QGIDADQRPGPDQGPGEQRRRAQAIVEQPLLGEQRLLGVIEPERGTCPHTHADVDQKIGENDQGDLRWARPAGVRCHAGPRVAWALPYRLCGLAPPPAIAALDAAVLDAHTRRQALEQHIRPEAVEPRRPTTGAEAILIGRLDQAAALDQAAKILFMQVRAED